MPRLVRNFCNFALLLLILGSSTSAQDLGPGFHKIKDGIYTLAPDASTRPVWPLHRRCL